VTGIIRREQELAALQADLQVPVQRDLLDQSTTHRSFAYEHGGIPENERLEFLGDSVLGIVITEYLYARFPDVAEGQLAKLRAAVVNAGACAEVARTLDLGRYMLLGRGEETTGGRDKLSILADAMEAVIGAIYLSSGLEISREFVLRMYGPLIEASAELGAGLDWKTSLQEAAADAGLGVPEYLVTDQGPDHEKEFHARVRLGDQILGEGTGRSKKIAEQQAASHAYASLREIAGH
jgi:ribonuclease-3